MKLKVLFTFFYIAFLASYFVYLNDQPPRKASRALASVDQGFDFLSKNELKLLAPNDLKEYLSKISQTIEKAGVFEGVFRDKSKSKVSFNHQLLPIEFSFRLPNAYAVYHCPMYGLHPFVRVDKAACNSLPKALKISEDSESLFSTSAVEFGSNREDKQSIAKCPEGQKMCNPALIGFDFENGKASLRCLDDATNANCYNQMKTTGEQMRKSLEIIDKANPKYWDEFQKGMEEQCLKNGKFNDSDEGCVYAKKQINYSTRTYRNMLSQKYKDLAAKLGEQDSVDATNKKVCKQFTKTDSEMSIADHKNFNAPGFKIMYKRGRCWRLPSKSIVNRDQKKYKVLLPNGSERSAQDLASINYDAPNSTTDASVVLMEDIGGIGADSNRTGDVRFYNFQCGPCNDAENISACVFNMRKPKAERKFSKINDNKATVLGTDDCRALITKLETAELPDVVFEKAKQKGASFHSTGSID